jgi:hypothetical protein
MAKRDFFAWHVHHGRLYELLNEPIENRRSYIRREKPKEEVEIRLKLLKVIKGKIPKALKDGLISYEVGGEIGWNQKEALYHKYSFRMENLHKKECKNCPWNGKTIFPKIDVNLP